MRELRRLAIVVTDDAVVRYEMAPPGAVDDHGGNIADSGESEHTSRYIFDRNAERGAARRPCCLMRGLDQFNRRSVAGSIADRVYNRHGGLRSNHAMA